jgi:hypothetical protein
MTGTRSGVSGVCGTVVSTCTGRGVGVLEACNVGTAICGMAGTSMGGIVGAGISGILNAEFCSFGDCACPNAVQKIKTKDRTEELPASNRDTGLIVSRFEEERSTMKKLPCFFAVGNPDSRNCHFSITRQEPPSNRSSAPSADSRLKWGLLEKKLSPVGALRCTKISNNETFKTR